MISDLWQEHGIYITEVLKSNLCDYNDVYILVRDKITIIGRNATTQVAFKNYARFINYITKIDGSTIDDAEELDLVEQAVYDFIRKIKNFKSFKYKAKLLGDTEANEENGI